MFCVFRTHLYKHTYKYIFVYELFILEALPMYKQAQPIKLWNCCWCPACCIKRASRAAVRAHNSPTCGFHILGFEYSPVSSCGSAELQFGSCCAGGHHGWTRAALRLACASLSSSGSHSLEDLWFDQQEKEVSPKTNTEDKRKESYFACWMQVEQQWVGGWLPLPPPK